MNGASEKYFVLIAGQKHGPFSVAQLRDKLVERKIAATDYAWSDGMPEWVPIQAVVNDTTVRNQSPAPWSSQSGDLEVTVRRAQLAIKLAAVGAIIAAGLLVGYLVISN